MIISVNRSPFNKSSILIMAKLSRTKRKANYLVLIKCHKAMIWITLKMLMNFPNRPILIWCFI